MSHEMSGESDEWYTPKYIFDALGVVFDLDVASPPEGPRYVPARNYYSEGALEKDWKGFVWMNPPFGNQSNKRKWIKKFLDHGYGLALLPDRTSAPWWQEFAREAEIIMFVSPKIKFERPDGSVGESPGAGTTIFGCGGFSKVILERATSLGSVFTPFKEE